MATQQNFELFRGEDGLLTVTLVPVTNITGWTIKFYLKSLAETTAAPLLTITATITSPSTGVFTVALTSAQTEALVSGRYRFDIWREGSGVNTLLTWGYLDLKGQVRFEPPA